MAHQIELLKDRAFMLKRSRAFFEERAVMELDCPSLNATANIDDSIDPIGVTFCTDKRGYLHTSPELFMKKLLAKGVGDCYFLGHVFRDHEKGEMHHIEFTMVEWYRHDFNYESMIDEVVQYIHLFIPKCPKKAYSYHEALLKYAHIDYTKASLKDLQEYVCKHIDIKLNFEHESFTDLLILIFTEMVEPHFKQKELIILKDFPKEQAALAKVKMVNNLEVAKRFEIYYQGVELANGYDELVGDHELFSRYTRLNEKRVLLGKQKLPIDQEFIDANRSLPDCCGVAVGFDRLMMLRHEHHTIHETMALIHS